MRWRRLPICRSWCHLAATIGNTFAWASAWCSRNIGLRAVVKQTLTVTACHTDLSGCWPFKKAKQITVPSSTHWWHFSLVRAAPSTTVSLVRSWELIVASTTSAIVSIWCNTNLHGPGSESLHILDPSWGISSTTWSKSLFHTACKIRLISPDKNRSFKESKSLWDQGSWACHWTAAKSGAWKLQGDFIFPLPPQRQLHIEGLIRRFIDVLVWHLKSKSSLTTPGLTFQD